MKGGTAVFGAFLILLVFLLYIYKDLPIADFKWYDYKRVVIQDERKDVRYDEKEEKRQERRREWEEEKNAYKVVAVARWEKQYKEGTDAQKEKLCEGAIADIIDINALREAEGKEPKPVHWFCLTSSVKTWE